MTVKELKDLLGKFPDDMRVMTSKYSDMVDLAEPALVEACVKEGGFEQWYEKFYPNQYREGEAVPSHFTVLYFDGN